MTTGELYFAGIRPDPKGAVVLISGSGKVLSVADLPTSGGRQGDDHLNPALLYQTLHTFPVTTYFIVEERTPRLKPSSGDPYRLGRSLGMVEGVLSAIGFEYDRVSAPMWQQAHRVYGAANDFRRTRALELDAELAPHLTTKDTLPRADAYLMARYGLSVAKTDDAS